MRETIIIYEVDMTSSIWQSRKFWLMTADVVVSLATYFIGKYMNPAAAQDLLFLIGAVQPVVIAVIVSITVQNLEGIKSNAELKRAQVYADSEAFTEIKIAAIKADPKP